MSAGAKRHVRFPPHQEAQGPDQAHQDVARLGLPHLRGPRIHRDRLDERVGPGRCAAGASSSRQAETGSVAETFGRLSSQS